MRQYIGAPTDPPCANSISGLKKKQTARQQFWWCGGIHPARFTLLAVERDTHCMFILLAGAVVERNTLLYAMEYTLHAHTTSVKNFKKRRTEQFRAPRLFSYQSPIN